MSRITVYAIVIVLFTMLLLVACELISPLTPEESCLQTSTELVDRNNDEESDWPIKVTNTIPITTDPVLCKGTAVFQDGSTYYIQFYENSNEIGFEGYISQTCQELAEQIILMGSTESDWPVKLENLIRIDEDPGERLTCKAQASYQDDSIEAQAIHEEIDPGAVNHHSGVPQVCDVMQICDAGGIDGCHATVRDEDY